MLKKPLYRLLVVATTAIWVCAIPLFWLSDRSGAALLPIAAKALAAYLLLWGAIALASSMSPRDRLVRFWLTSATLGVVILLLELPAVLHVIDYRDIFGTRAPKPWLDPRNQLDQELHHLRRPHQRLVGNKRGGDLAGMANWPLDLYSWDITYDANGFRNPPPGITRADVAVVGDSFVEGVVIPHEQLLTSVLARESATVVANLGQYAYGPQQELAVLRRFALPLHPKTIVWVFFEGNDLFDLVQYEQIHANWSRIQAADQQFRRRSFTANLLLGLDKLTRPRTASSTAVPSHLKRGRFIRKDAAPIEMCFAYEPRPLGTSENHALDRLVPILRQAHALCDESGVRFVVAFAPVKFRVYGEFCEFHADSPYRHFDVNDLPTRLRSLLHDLSPDIGFVDLTHDAISAAREGKLLYFPDDIHWSPDGHEAAGRTIARYLNETPVRRPQ